MLVFDLSRPDTLEAVEEWMREIREHAGDVKVILIGNKADLKKKRAIKEADIQPWIDRYGCAFVETSALNGDGVEEAFRTLTVGIIEKLEQ
jgi:small GTP-binding protein